MGSENNNNPTFTSGKNKINNQYSTQMMSALTLSLIASRALLCQKHPADFVFTNRTLDTLQVELSEDQGKNKVAIRAFDGHYVTLDFYLVGTFKATAESVTDATLFILVGLGEDTLPIQADNGQYWRADFGDNAGLSAASAEIGTNQIFALVRH